MYPAQNNRHLPADKPVFFDDFTTQKTWNAARETLPFQLSMMPAVNIFETLDAFFIELYVPGISIEELRFFSTDRSIEVRYEPDKLAFEPYGTRRNWHTGHRPQGFRRQFDLNPDALDIDALEVESDNGVVRLQYPKKENFRGRVQSESPFSLN